MNNDYTWGDVLILFSILTILLVITNLPSKYSETVKTIGGCEYLEVRQGISYSYTPLDPNCVPDMELLKPN